jgi:hypothetical protein
MESWAEGFENLKQWIQTAASIPGAAGTADAPGMGVLSPGDLVTLAACVDDVRGHLLSASSSITSLFSEQPDVEALDTCLVEVGVQLTQAVRNFGQLSELLVARAIWPDDLWDDQGPPAEGEG